MHRTCSPQETISQIEPYFEKIGLTRLADITGLDRIGIPVILSVRPNSTFLAVDAGKGITPEAATASAAMEYIERYHAGYGTSLDPEIAMTRAITEACQSRLVSSFAVISTALRKMMIRG